MLSLTHPLQLALGLVLWSIWFVAIYGGLSVACAVAAPPAELGARTWINASLLVATLIPTVLLLLMAYRCSRLPIAPGTSHFVVRVAAGGYLASAIATLTIGLTSATLPPCV